MSVAGADRSDWIRHLWAGQAGHDVTQLDKARLSNAGWARLSLAGLVVVLPVEAREGKAGGVQHGRNELARWDEIRLGRHGETQQIEV